jgi:hypothetical protein
MRIAPVTTEPHELPGRSSDRQRHVPGETAVEIAAEPTSIFRAQRTCRHCGINPVHIRRLWDPVAGRCYSAPARANKSWSRYRRLKTERSCIEAYPGRDARTRQTELLFPIWRTRLRYDPGCQRPLGIFLIHHIERTERSLLRL